MLRKNSVSNNLNTKQYQPKVSIVILNWNNYEDTIECIESLEEISYRNFEIIIVDNGSTNDSEKILRKKFGSYEFIQTGKNLGFTGGNNVGIRTAINNGADYVLLLNNDTVVEKDFLEPLVGACVENAEIGMVAPKILYYDEPNKIWAAGGSIIWWRGSGFQTAENKLDSRKYREDQYVSFITGCAMLIKEKTIRKVGLLDEDYFAYSEDVDYCTRVIKAHLKIKYVGRSIIYHKVRSRNNGRVSSTRAYYNLRNRMLFMKKNSSRMYFWIFIIFMAFNLIFKFAIWFFSKKRYLIKASKKSLEDFLSGKVGEIEYTL